MRVGSFFLVVVILLQRSAAERRRRTSFQRDAHKEAIVSNRDRLTTSDASITAPIEIPEIVVYVDQTGNPVSTATETIVYVPLMTSSPAPPSTQPSAPSPTATSVTSVSSTAEPAAIKETTPAAGIVDTTATTVAEATPAYSSDPSESLASSTAVPTVGSASRLHGVTYSPYTALGTCKSASEVDGDFAVFGHDHGVVRLYGVDCDQIASAYAAAKKHSNKLFLGIFDVDAVPFAVSTMAAGLDNDWSIVDTVSVGNELVNNGAKSPHQVVAAVQQARTALRAVGYQGPVVIVDTFVAAIKYPELCDNSDYCAVNVHPFFDPNTGAAQAGSFVTSQLENVRRKLSDPRKRIVVTETGWPWKGDPNGAAVPGMDNQAQAISSLKSSFSSNPGDCILFTAFNDLWKQASAGTFFAEQYWGMGGRYSACDS